ncbi:uncharacterized protein LOC135377522 isoform X2 [Ornithodoros turicata]|uniref:uncharacterized protein LOC135377522 isoform X2 n=1 Tax=Ornithodoros turicata TaxID=34597 RepID=UPI00313A4A8D
MTSSSGHADGRQRTKQLRLSAFWTHDNDETDEQHLEALRSFFESRNGTEELQMVEEVEILDVGVCSKTKHFEEAMLKAEVVVTLLQDNTHAGPGLRRRRKKKEEELDYALIGRLWCEDNNPQGLLQWLQPNRSEGFWRGGIRFERNVHLAVLGFGTLSGLTTFALRHLLGPSSSLQFSQYCEFKHDERLLHIYLETKHAVGCVNSKNTLYRLVVHYHQILRVLVKDSTRTGQRTDILLQLQSMPLLYQRANGLEPARSSVHGIEPALIDVEQQTYERTLTLGCECSSILYAKELSGCSTLCLGIQDKFKARHILGRLNKRCDCALGFYYVPLRVVDLGQSIVLAANRLKEVALRFHFPICYAMHAVLFQGDDLPAQFALLNTDQQEDFINNIRQMAVMNPSAFERALFELRLAIEGRSVLCMESALRRAFASSLMHQSPKVPPGACLVRRVLKMPSRIVLLPPQVHSENRVLREYDPEYALRVAFRDDNLQRISFTIMFHSEKEAFLRQVVGQFLSDGMSIGSRDFRFLAASSSQLREHGVWMYATDTKGNSVHSIRNWMGDFSSVKGVAKRMARMGQCFSSTEETVSVPMDSNQVKRVPDIKLGMHPVLRTRYVFSDGIGAISPLLLEQVCKKLGLQKTPSAIQIRYAGYKGMLCINSALKGLCMTLRPSMCKFECPSSNKLEVIKTSAPRPVCLNRQLITILEQLGVSSRVFLQLQQNTVLNVTDALASETKALEVLSSSFNSSGPSRLKELMPLKKLHKAGGLCLSHDPFFRSLLFAVYRDAVDGLRSKSRIAVPPNKGRNMLGVLDETEKLAYGQVFVQYTELYNEDEPCQTSILTGTVLVTKCPCLHPGDVRKFTAVDVPELHAIRDCIVFPSKGDRPHPNEMAGSDLDGDEYIVIWEEDLFFPGPNKEPMVYDDEESKPHCTSVTENDMIQFICDYIKHDSVGVISNAHLAWADDVNHGIFSRVCLNLAKKVSKSLDFAKSGMDAPYLDRNEKPSRYPDFMEKGGSKNTYRSQRVLGQLYRVGRSLEAVVSTSCEACSDYSKQSVLFELPGWTKYKKFAEQGLEQYRTRMEAILGQFGIQSEGEVVTGVIHSAPHLYRGNKEKMNMELLVDKQYRSLVERTQREFFDKVESECLSLGVKGQALERTVTLQVASAYYMVTYMASPEDGRRFQRRLFGFPWCLSDVMLQLLIERRNTGSFTTPLDVPLNMIIAKINGEVKSESGQSAEELARTVVVNWAEKEELLGSKTKGFCPVCPSCLDAVFTHFYNQHLLLANGHSEEAYAKDSANDYQFFEGDLTSVGSLVVGFLRRIGSEFSAITKCVDCSVGIGGQHAHVLMLAALRTYSMLALSCDPCHLGLPCDKEQHEPYQEIQEGNPVRLLVESATLLNKLREEHEEVQDLLAKWSGVHEVHIRGNRDFRKRTYILVSATGRDWQRWLLEELLLQPWLPDAISSGNLHPYINRFRS